MPGIRYALRSLSKQPGFCISAILTLALGIGVNIAMFSVFDAVIVHPLPYRDAGRLVLVWESLPGRKQNPVVALNFVEWSKQAHSFERLFGMKTLFVSFRNGDESHQLLAGQLSQGFLTEMGVPPVMGREFLPSEYHSDHDHVAILSYKLWQSEFASDSRALGQHVNLNGESYNVVGVAAPNFDESLAMRGVEIWTPLSLDQPAALRSGSMAVFGRLKRGIGIAAADREMQIIAKRLEEQYPDLNRGWSAGVTSLEDYGIGKLRPTVAALLIGVGMVLLIACVNVANLLLARSQIRYRESAVRAALGASRARLFCQLLTETMILAFAGSVAGIALAYAGLRLIIALNAVNLPGLGHAGLNGRVLVFTLGVAMVTGLLFGLFPSRQLIGGDLLRAIRESGRGVVSPRGRSFRNMLVISEIALSLILLAGAAMMARNLLWLQNENRGFVPDHLLSFRISFPGTDFPDQAAMSAYYTSFLDGIAALPGVRATGANTNLPIDGFLLVGQFFRLPGAQPPPAAERPIAACNLVNGGFLRALGIPLIEGREFDGHDRLESKPVAIVSASLAHRFFPGEDPVGRKIIVPTPGKSEIEVAREIVGVAGDIRYLTRPSAESLEIYMPYAQAVWPNLYVFVRTRGDPSLVTPQLRALFREPGLNRQSVADLMTMQERIIALNDKPRLNSLLAVLFASVALLLAAVGIYGVVSYSALQRTQEIGVRIAVGATPRHIIGSILGRALLLTIAGIAVGLIGTFALSRVLASLLYGATSVGWPLLFAVLVLGSVALLASYIPARRAVRGDPVTALRAE